MLWFSNDNPSYVRAVYDIETTKADIARLKLELSRHEETKASAIAQAELLEANIEYVKKYAKVVSMREYVRLRHMLAGEYEIVLFAKNAIPSLERVIKMTEASLTRLESSLPSYQSKVLEFRRRD